jgi:hypothetical protein
MMRRTPRAAGVALLLAAVAPFLAGGCSPSPETATVTGTVTYRGAPLKSGEITVLHESGASRSAVIGSDGRFQIENAPTGEVSVGVTATVQEEVKAAAVAASPDGDRVPDAPPVLVERSLVPKKYNDPKSSGLKYTLKAGSQVIEVPLKE